MEVRLLAVLALEKEFLKKAPPIVLATALTMGTAWIYLNNEN
jgi:hypothetical protein